MEKDIIEEIKAIKEKRDEQVGKIERLKGHLQVLVEDCKELKEEVNAMGVEYDTLEDLEGIKLEFEGRLEDLIENYKQRLGLEEE